MLIFSVVILCAACLLLGVALWNALAWRAVGADETTSVEAESLNSNFEAVNSDVETNAPQPSSISILIPARDEATNIAACLDAALAQTASLCEVLVYDDHSTDATAEIVGEYARRDARVRLVVPAPLPPDWCGKTFACAELAHVARGRWLLFLDADARLAENSAARIVGEAERCGVTLLSCWPRLETRGFWEGALMPLLNFVVFTLYPAPLALRRRHDPSLGLAHGSCILARRDVYEHVGGHAAVRAELFEDVRLAQTWRARGHLSLCLDGQRVVSVRMYNSLAEIWRGFQKNFYPAFRRSRSFWAFIALHFLVCLLPFALAPFLFSTVAGRAFALAAACVLASRVALAVRFGQAWWSVALHPLGECVLIALGLSSWWACHAGRGVVWKGRRYAGQFDAAKARTVNDPRAAHGRDDG